MEGAVLRIRIRDPVPFWPLNPESGIRNRFFPDPGSQSHIFESLVKIFWLKSSKILWKLAQIFFLQHFKTKIIYNFVKFVATWKGMTTNFFHPSLLLLFLDPRSGIRDPGWVKIRIRDKHPGSATLGRGVRFNSPSPLVVPMGGGGGGEAPYALKSPGGWVPPNPAGQIIGGTESWEF